MENETKTRLNTPIENPVSKIGRRRFLRLAGGTALASIVAACAPQPVPQAVPVPVEVKPGPVNNPIKVEAPPIRDNDTPEKRFKNWFNSVVGGNQEEYRKQFIAEPQPLQKGLTELYKSCDVNKVTVSDIKQRQNNIVDLVFDFQTNCIPGDRKSPNGVRYAEVRMQRDDQGIYRMISASVSSSPKINPALG